MAAMLPSVARQRLETAASSASDVASALARALSAGTEPQLNCLIHAASSPPKWTPRLLALHTPALHRVYESSDDPRFGPYHDAQRPLARALRLRPLHNYSELTHAMPTTEFFTAHPSTDITQARWIATCQQPCSAMCDRSRLH